MQVRVGWGQYATAGTTLAGQPQGDITFPAQFAVIGTDLRVTFLSASLSPRLAVHLSFFTLQASLQTLKVTRASPVLPQVTVEYRDTNIPALPLSRPSEGPQTGGGLVLAALTGIPQALDEGAVTTCSVPGLECKVMGLVRLKDWEMGSGSYKVVMTDAEVLRWALLLLVTLFVRFRGLDSFFEGGRSVRASGRRGGAKVISCSCP